MGRCMPNARMLSERGGMTITSVGQCPAFGEHLHEVSKGGILCQGIRVISRPFHAESAGLRDLVRDSRRRQLDRVGPDDPSSPVRVLVELDILNAYERIRGYYLNIAETLAGGKG